MTQNKQPPAEPSPRSGGITVGDQTAQGNVTTHLENVAGRDQISHSQVVQHADNVYLVQKPGFSEKPGFLPVSWDTALDLVATRLKQIRDEHGPDSIAFLVSAKCTNEENYLLQKLARAVIGTNNVDHCARL